MKLYNFYIWRRQFSMNKLEVRTVETDKPGDVKQSIKANDDSIFSITYEHIRRVC